MDTIPILLIAVIAVGLIAAVLDSYGLLDSFQALVARDRLGVWGVGAAAIALLLWAWPGCVSGNGYGCIEEWFSFERLPAVAAFLALSFILLLLRRR